MTTKGQDHMTITATPTSPTSPTMHPALNVADRCDACGAQAFVRAVLTNGDLLFCGHHGRAYADKLAAVAVLVQDGTSGINTKPSPSAYYRSPATAKGPVGTADRALRCC